MSNRAIARKLPGALALTASLTLGVGCTEPDVRIPNAIRVLAGNSQEGEVGERLPAPIEVEVTDVHGRPVPRISVRFEVTTPQQPGFIAGTVTPASVETSVSGIARATWTLGTAAGPQTLRVQLDPSQSGTTLYMDAQATARAGPLASIRPALDPVVAITVGDSVEVAVVGVDRYGNAVWNLTGVSWQVADPAVASASSTSPGPGRVIVLGRSRGTTVLEARYGASSAARFDVRTYVGPGRDIAYALNGTIYVLSADGATTTALGPGADPAWSPDGRQIAFSHGGAVHVMNADGSGRRALTDPVGLPNAKHPAWSPDGSRIAFAAPASRSSADGSLLFTSNALFVMNADGSSRTLVLFTQGACVRGCVGAQYPAWSPDGSRIVYSSVNYSTPARGSVFVVNADGAGDRMLPIPGINREAAWSPDGGRVAFAGSPPCPYICANIGDVYTTNADATGTKRLTFATSAGFSDASPTWSPDSRIAFLRVSYPVNWPGPTELFVVNGDGTELRRVLRVTGAITRPAWRPSP